MMAAAGSNAVITGVSVGIGNNLARFLLREGWSVYGLSRRKPDIEDAQFFWRQCDITDVEAIASLTQRLPATIDAVVHNAGASGGVGPGLDIALEAWRAAFEVNFFAPLNLTKQIVQRCRPNACFIFLSGGGSVTPKPFVGPYAVSKLAVTKLAEQLALEYRTFRFYAMAPGAHNTQLFAEQNSMSSGKPPPFGDFAQVERLLQTLIADSEGRLSGKLVHVRDDIEQLLSVRDGGTVRRVERR
jgi:NAD(P)-dependent dehydrogenase (short-subunit alcohol dehydrogenase family)